MIQGPCSLDTSVVLRLLVREPVILYTRATEFLSEQVAAHSVVHVNDLVLAETYFALQSFYQMSKADALKALALFIRHSGVTATAAASEVLGLANLATAKPGFVDRLIHGSSRSNGQTLVTFEKAAQKLPSTLLLNTEMH